MSLLAQSSAKVHLRFTQNGLSDRLRVTSWKPPTPEVIEVAKVMLAMKGLNEQKLRGGGRRR